MDARRFAPLALFALACTTVGCDPKSPAHAGAAPSEMPAPATEIASQPAVDAGDSAAQQDPKLTRGGQPRFADESIEDPAMAPVLLARLRDGGESSEVRAALAAALPRTGGEWAEALVDMLADEDDPAVRVAMVSTLHRAPPAIARRGLALGLDDGDAAVRYEAAMTAASVPSVTDEPALTGILRQRLTDGDARTRAAAARSLGVLGVTEAFAEIAALVADDDSHVRLESLQALGRLDREQARTIAAGLVDDDDDSVSRAALRLRRADAESK